ncbi:sensor histidine kinase [Arthrobacter sp. 35W]|uniref:sensor histidine kinase n=1 Tax=Arthrobacter sp. 35W TaxID=1132441 RepID=UPI0018C964E6|nr:sensor histidine kinase [Arthrobacter sp. 35W]
MTYSAAAPAPRGWFIGRPSTWRMIGADLAYLLPGFFVSLVSFIVLVTLLATGAGTFIIWIGLPILVLSLSAASFFAGINRAALRRWAGAIPPVHYRPLKLRTIKGMLAGLADAQRWKDVLHGTLVSFPLRTVAFSFVVSWLATAAAGLTKWFWSPFLPQDSVELAQLMGLDVRWGMNAADVQLWLDLAVGVLFLLTLPFVVHFFAVADAGAARFLLTNENAALRARSAELSQRRAQVVSEEAQTLRKVERDLHDGPQQRLIRLQMDVEAAKRQVASNPEQAVTLMDGAIEQSRAALAELRALSRGIAPPILADRGLAAATASLAGRCPVPATVADNLGADARLAEGVENAAYFVVSEALANAAKHSRAGAVSVALRRLPTELAVVVRDDGVGGAHVGKGHGLAGLVDRLAGVDGTLGVDSPDGGPTTITARIPLEAPLAAPPEGGGR